MASKPQAKAAPKKAMPARGQRTATHTAGLAISPSNKAQEAKWRAQEDMHHLKRAAEVKADPARHKAAVSHAKAEMQALQSVVKK